MFWSNKRHKLRRSKRPTRPLRYQYQEREPSHHSRYYDHGSPFHHLSEPSPCPSFLNESEKHPNELTDHPPPRLTTLPPELHLSIFDNLDPVSSACLGLTTKKFYPLHRSAHRKVGLYQGAEQPLHELLKNWKPKDLVLDWESEKLVSRERLEILEEVRRRERDRRAQWIHTGYYPGAYRHFERDRDRERVDGYGVERIGPRYEDGGRDREREGRRLRRRGRLERKNETWVERRR
jgi:hypothetical protein